MHQQQVGIGKGEYALNIAPPVSRSCLPDVDIIHEVEVVILSFPENWRLNYHGHSVCRRSGLRETLY